MNRIVKLELEASSFLDTQVVRNNNPCQCLTRVQKMSDINASQRFIDFFNITYELLHTILNNKASFPSSSIWVEMEIR